jgi:hypothetical protein
MSALSTKMKLSNKGNQMTKTLAVLALIAHVVAFLFATYLMVLDEYGYTFVYSVIIFATLPFTIVLVANKLSK